MPLWRGPVWYSTQHCTALTQASPKFEFRLTKDNTYLALGGKLWGVDYEDLGEFYRVTTAPHCILSKSEGVHWKTRSSMGSRWLFSIIPCYRQNTIWNYKYSEQHWHKHTQHRAFYCQIPVRCWDIYKGIICWQSSGAVVACGIVSITSIEIPVI